jgi:hypothetical protein
MNASIVARRPRASWRSRRISAALVALLAAAFMPPPALAQQALERTWLEPLVTEDSFASNEADVLPGWRRGGDGRTFSLTVELEKKLSPSTSLEAEGEWHQQSPEGRAHDRTGFDDLETLLKRVLYLSPAHEFRLAAGIDSLWPAGDRQVEGQRSFLTGPMVMWAKGMGDLPHDPWLRWMRPIDIQGDAGYLFELSSSSGGDAFADAAFTYNLPYLAADIGAENVLWPLRNLAPFIEVNYSEVPTGRRGRTPAEFFITPGLSYFTGPYQFTLGSQVALDHAASRQDYASVLGLVDINLSAIFPAIRWTPF